MKLHQTIIKDWIITEKSIKWKSAACFSKRHLTGEYVENS